MGDHDIDLDPGRDLVLEQKDGKGNKVLHVVLSNVHGQKYTFGSKYPGARDGEEFVFCRLGDKGLIEPTHCTISVDKGGNYWIEKATSTAKTFVNLETIAERRPLKDGDIISLGIPKNCWCTPGPLFLVDFRLPDSKIYELEDRKEVCKNEVQVHEIDESPLDNVLVLSKILDYLPFRDVKNSRLVCKKWNEEGSKILKKKGQVCFNFGGDYGKPQNSTSVHRYLHEMERMKIRKVEIKLSPTEIPESFFIPGEPGEKMLIDLGKLLSSSHNFSSLVLDYSSIINESTFSLLHLILEKLGPKLVELELQGSILYLPKIISPLPKMNHLKKLRTQESSLVLIEGRKWVSHLVPLFKNNLEHFSPLNVDASTLYLEEFLKHKMRKLDEFVSDIFDKAPKILALLLQLKTPLTYLRLCCICEEDNVYPLALLENLLWKNSQSLKHLALEVDSGIVIRFPSFSKLEELHIQYSLGARIIWNWNGNGGLHYNKHFPSLRKLKIELYDESPFNLEGDRVFNSFFPEGRDFPCGTVTQLCIPALVNPEDEDDLELELSVKQWRAIERSYNKFQERFTKIKKMFPKVEKIETDEFCPTDCD